MTRALKPVFRIAEQKWILALVLILTMVLLARLMTADKPKTKERPFVNSALLDQQSSSSMPPSIPLPDTQWPVIGTVIQTGAFSQLSDAEAQQYKLNDLGISPYIEKSIEKSIEKKFPNKALLYIVLLGPFYQDTERAKVIEKLTINSLKYIERPDL